MPGEQSRTGERSHSLPYWLHRWRKHQVLWTDNWRQTATQARGLLLLLLHLLPHILSLEIISYYSIVKDEGCVSPRCRDYTAPY